MRNPTTELELMNDLSHELFDCYCVCDEIMKEGGNINPMVVKILKENIGLIRELVEDVTYNVYTWKDNE